MNPSGDFFSTLQAEQQRAERAAEELEELTLRPEISGMALKLKAAEGEDRQPAWQRLASRKAERVQVRDPGLALKFSVHP